MTSYVFDIDVLTSAFFDEYSESRRLLSHFIEEDIRPFVSPELHGDYLFSLAQVARSRGTALNVEEVTNLVNCFCAHHARWIGIDYDYLDSSLDAGQMTSHLIATAKSASADIISSNRSYDTAAIRTLDPSELVGG